MIEVLIATALSVAYRQHAGETPAILKCRRSARESEETPGEMFAILMRLRS
ncbi:MAG: hypothetical protein LBP59_02955 [Planctomycetaceae bacterium]|jgi:hypothetical protein|nr:hypothetical protein [Planctomycetaceae bacterium]